MGWYIGAAVTIVVLSGFLAIVIGLGIPIDDTPENTGEKQSKLDGLPAPLPVERPSFHDAEYRL